MVKIIYAEDRILLYLKELSKSNVCITGLILGQVSYISLQYVKIKLKQYSINIVLVIIIMFLMTKIMISNLEESKEYNFLIKLVNVLTITITNNLFSYKNIKRLDSKILYAKPY